MQRSGQAHPERVRARVSAPGSDEVSGRTTRVEILDHALEQRRRERRPGRVADADLLLKVLVQTFALSCHHWLSRWKGPHAGSREAPETKAAFHGVEPLFVGARLC